MANKLLPPALKPNRRLVLFGASALALAGCGSLGLGPTDTNDTIYLMQPAIKAAPQGGQPASWALAVDIPDALDSIDSRRLALIKQDSTLDYFAGVTWPDRLPVLVQTALVAAFQASGRVPSVARTQDALHADYELGVEIRDCTAHYTQSDDGKPSGTPTVTVILVAQMSTSHGRKIAANFTARQDVPASQNSTAAVVAAINAAMGAAVDQLVNWAVALPPPPSTP